MLPSSVTSESVAVRSIIVSSFSSIVSSRASRSLVAVSMSFLYSLRLSTVTEELRLIKRIVKVGHIVQHPIDLQLDVSESDNDCRFVCCQGVFEPVDIVPHIS